MVYGIDLGTTYSAIAECDERGEARVISNGIDGGIAATTTPSVVWFEKESGAPTVGQFAKNNLSNEMEAGQIVNLFKREMGREFCEKQVQRLGERRNVSPVEASACVLHYLMKYANVERRDPIQKAVVTIPVSYTYQQRACVKKAAELAGIELLGMLHEPYGIQPGETILVFDLGGGTLDVSVVKCLSENNYDVLGIASDSNLVEVGNYIGGQDWDNALCELALRDLQGMDTSNRPQLLDSAEKCKIALSKVKKAPFIYNGKAVDISRKDFENMTIDLVDRCCQVVQLAIDDAQNKANEKGDTLVINRFVLTGGSSNMPMVRNALKNRFTERYSQGRPDREWIPLFAPEQAIAKGAAMVANLIEQGKYTIEEKSPYSYGTQWMDDERNLYIKNLLLSSDPMIVSEGRDFIFTSRGSKGVIVDVYENRNPSENSFLYNESGCRLVGEKYFYQFDYDVEYGTPVIFTVTRDKDGLIGIVVTSDGHHEERFQIDTRTSPISPEVEQQIRRTIQLMDEEIETE